MFTASSILFASGITFLNHKFSIILEKFAKIFLEIISNFSFVFSNSKKSQTSISANFHLFNLHSKVFSQFKIKVL